MWKLINITTFYNKLCPNLLHVYAVKFFMSNNSWNIKKFLIFFEKKKSFVAKIFTLSPCYFHNYKQIDCENQTEKLGPSTPANRFFLPLNFPSPCLDTAIWVASLSFQKIVSHKIRKAHKPLKLFKIENLNFFLPHNFPSLCLDTVFYELPVYLS